MAGVCQDNPADCRQTPCRAGFYCDLGSGQCRLGCASNADCPQPGSCDLATHVCACDPGHHRCGNQCLSNGSAQSCGASCTPCAAPSNATATCNGTSCGFSCNAGYHACSGQCLSNASVQSCGTSCTPCTAPANATATCNGTSCGFSCNAGYHACSGQCLSDTSTQSCGTSCTPCTAPANATATCNGTSCGFTCNAGYHACSGQCLPDTSPNSCGTSCAPCPAGPSNSRPVCQAGSCGYLCLTGYSPCGSQCVNLLRDGQNCGACARVCAGGQVCSQGDCRSTCAQPWTMAIAGVVDGGSEASALYPQDLDGDGRLDLTVVDQGMTTFPYSRAQVRVLYNDGGFDLRAGAPLALDHYALDSAQADFNGDGRLDLLVPTQSYSSGFYSCSLWQLLRSGSGYTARTVGAGNYYTPIASSAAGDLDQDGYAEGLFVAGALSQQWTVHLLRGWTNGLQPEVSTDAGVHRDSTLAVGDFDRDGLLDVLTAARPTGAVQLFRGLGQRTLGAPLGVATVTEPVGLLVADLNGDALLDVVVLRDWGLRAGGLEVLRGSSTTPFLVRHQALSLPYPYATSRHAFALADVNGDGALDLLTAWGAVSTQFGNFTPSLLVLEGGANGTFGSPRVLPLAVPWLTDPSVAAGDLDGDGKWDVALATTGKVWLLQGQCP